MAICTYGIGFVRVVINYDFWNIRYLFSLATQGCKPSGAEDKNKSEVKVKKFKETKAKF
jgi:hypothetical protein